jgi:hypothetical protein
MTDGSSAAECAVSYRTPAVKVERTSHTMILRLKAIPWARVIVDAILLAGLLLTSSKLLAPR